MVSKVLVCALTVIAAVSCKPVCVIEGNLTGMEGDGWIYMVDAWDDSIVIDSTRYQDGVFRFEVDAAEPTMVMLTCNELPDPRLHRFFNDAGTLSLTGSVEVARKAQVSGTPLNDALNDVVSQMDEYYAESSMVKRQDRGMELFTEALNGNSGNALSLNLIEMSVQGMHPYVLLQYMEHLEPYLADKAHAKQLKEYLERLLPVSPAIEGCDVKPFYIDMEYPDVNGSMVKLSDIVNNPKNKCVYIDFWATWCGPCRMYMESLAETYKKYKDKGFEVYTVSCDTNTEAWRKLVTEQDFGWIDVIGGMSMPEWKSYVVKGVPTSILIDCSTGLIVGREIYGDMLDEKLEEIL